MLDLEGKNRLHQSVKIQDFQYTNSSFTAQINGGRGSNEPHENENIFRFARAANYSMLVFNSPVWLAVVVSDSPRAAEDVSGWSHTTADLFFLSLSQLDFTDSNLKSLRGRCILKSLFRQRVCSRAVSTAVWPNYVIRHTDRHTGTRVELLLVR